MYYTARPFSGKKDYMAMRKLLQAAYTINGPLVYATTGGIDWWRALRDNPKDWPFLRLWWDEKDELGGFAWLGSGHVDLFSHPTRRRVEADMLAWAEGRYDRVLIDSPPTLAASDTAVIGQLVDGVLMVVQPHKNQRRLVLRVAETFSMLKIPLIGLVANRVGAAGSSDYYGYSVDYSAPVEEDPEDVCFGDEIDCPPERTKRGTTTQPRREGGIDLSQLSGPRRRGAA